MEHKCSACQYFDLDSDMFPCVDCYLCMGGDKNSRWTPKIEDITDSTEILKTLFEQNNYILMELSRLRKELKENRHD